MELAILAITAFLAALFTFFSGFGLGTLLTPVFMVFFPIEIAIALTGITHLINNLFKLALVGKHANWPIVFKFGIPAVLAALAGAYLLLHLSEMPAWFSYRVGERSFQVYPIKLIVAILLLFFSAIELFPGLKKLRFENQMVLGGILSGFFGGLSGNQGAFRSAFLIKSGLSQEAFVATGVAIALGIDLTRLSTYSVGISFQLVRDNLVLLTTACLSAISGSYLGSRLLKKTTLRFMQVWVAVMLILFSFLIGGGIL